jgi:hypothetical protein
VALNLRLSTLLQVILHRLVFRVESAQWIFGVALFSSKLGMLQCYSLVGDVTELQS